jgi:cyclopropane fatty-acyl-phospholipid synthase-like methyltransferase
MSSAVDLYRRSRSSLALVLREIGRGAAMMARPGGPEALYDLLSSHNNLGQDTLYLNMGYWREARDYDAACEALAVLVAEHAQLGPGQRVLDAGFGFGDQVLLWADRFGVDIVGLNITRSQVDVARDRVRRANLSERVDLRHGSALATGLPDASVDRVIALESAFHFPSRDRFFAEARRVLRPGGRLVIADLVPRARASRRLVDRVGKLMARSFWKIPNENFYGRDEYAARIARAEFEPPRVTDITEHVFAPFGRFARARQAEADVAARANPLLRAVWRAPSATGVFDYLIFTANVP